jgi:hypothetical protein
MKRLMTGVVAVSLWISAGVAEASTITQTRDFNAAMTGGPVSIWSGSLTVTLDPTVDSSGLLDAFISNLPASYGQFEYVFNSLSDLLVIGDNCIPTSCGTLDGHDYAVLSVFPGGAFAAISTVNGGNFTSSDVFVSSVPGPAAGAGMPGFILAGASLLGWIRHKRRQRGAQPP